MTWIPVADLAEFTDSPVLAREAGGLSLALYRVEGAVYATQGLCTHAGVSLAGGEIVEGYIECPAHYGLFEIATGRAQGGPVCRDLATYPVRVEDGRVFVDVAPDILGPPTIQGAAEPRLRTMTRTSRS